MNPHLESSVALIIARDDDPWNALARHDENVDDDQRCWSSSSITSSSPTAVSASNEPSIFTRPTSYGTGYPVCQYQNEGKATATYAASLSATHGSEPETDAERDDALGVILSFAGAWSSSHQVQDQCLRKRENAKLRLPKTRLKKYPVVIHQTTEDESPLPQDIPPAPITAGPPSREDRRCLFCRIPRRHCIVFGLICLTVLTILSSGLTVYSTNRVEMKMRKRVTFVAATTVSFETVVTMLAARRPPAEALALGLFPLIIGFMVLLHFDSFF
ncbi:hypothetical protein C7974DRAFT_163936 [Boeremia exigua]|uniref:uncharacterized protein n=1 Tax=Boeremia exigua TaxID=749465 RepID=UPI001E8DF91D|nr:uncharacterized protein C7974DRAFT_163936 [Boeremia exigua]KAH6633052.1 hypothetical protein C7974DRAFT_163936 [Boeremia exigua]